MTAPTDRPLSGARIALCVTGSVAAYKSVLVLRELTRLGARVQVVASASGLRFVGAETFAALSGKPVLSEMFGADGSERHVTLAAESDLVVVAPATADLLARAASGRSDDLIAALLLAATCPIVLAPAMHPSMWANEASRRNQSALAADPRVHFVGPVVGEVASGEVGLGRLAEPAAIVERVVALRTPGDLAGRHLVVSAGPTVEDIDAVRFISNRSSGKMGFAIAARARARGARVTLIAGPVSLPTPAGVERVDVRSALDMRAALDDALGRDLSRADAVVMSAAVGDFRAKTRSEQKLKRGSSGLTLELEQNPDLIAGLAARRGGKTPLLMAFALETGSDAEIVDYARAKVTAKGVDVVVANHAGDSLGRDDNRATLVTAVATHPLPAMPKPELADRLLDWLVAELARRA